MTETAENGIVHLPRQGVELYRTSTDAASMCKEIVLRTAIDIQGRRYVRCEGWQSLAIAHGCFASSGDVERVEDPAGPGYRAIGKVVKADTGAVIATAEGFVGDDEQAWKKRPVYARRAMAQTRAISRACRSAFAHVVVMMNAGLETTPAEEVPREGFDAQPTGSLEEKLKQSVEIAKAKKKPAGVTIPYGNNKGKSPADCSASDLEWLKDRLEEAIEDPEKKKFLHSNQALLEAIEAELETRT